MNMVIEFGRIFISDSNFILWRMFVFIAIPLWLIERTILRELRKWPKTTKQTKQDNSEK